MPEEISIMPHRAEDIFIIQTDNLPNQTLYHLLLLFLGIDKTYQEQVVAKVQEEQKNVLSDLSKLDPRNITERFLLVLHSRLPSASNPQAFIAPDFAKNCFEIMQNYLKRFHASFDDVVTPLEYLRTEISEVFFLLAYYDQFAQKDSKLSKKAYIELVRNLFPQKSTIRTLFGSSDSQYALGQFLYQQLFPEASTVIKAALSQLELSEALTNSYQPNENQNSPNPKEISKEILETYDKAMERIRLHSNKLLINYLHALFAKSIGYSPFVFALYYHFRITTSCVYINPSSNTTVTQVNALFQQVSRVLKSDLSEPSGELTSAYNKLVASNYPAPLNSLFQNYSSEVKSEVPEAGVEIGELRGKAEIVLNDISLFRQNKSTFSQQKEIYDALTTKEFDGSRLVIRDKKIKKILDKADEIKNECEPLDLYRPVTFPGFCFAMLNKLFKQKTENAFYLSYQILIELTRLRIRLPNYLLHKWGGSLVTQVNDLATHSSSEGGASVEQKEVELTGCLLDKEGYLQLLSRLLLIFFLQQPPNITLDVLAVNTHKLCKTINIDPMFFLQVLTQTTEIALNSTAMQKAIGDSSGIPPELAQLIVIDLLGYCDLIKDPFYSHTALYLLPQLQKLLTEHESIEKVASTLEQNRNGWCATM
jgi:hypothetical protein